MLVALLCPCVPAFIPLPAGLQELEWPTPAGASAVQEPDPDSAAVASLDAPLDPQVRWAGLPIDGLEWGGWLRFAGEDNTFDGAGKRLSGELSDLRIWTEGRVAGLAWRASVEAGKDEIQLADLWVRTPLDDRHDFFFGRFRTPFLRSGFIEENRLLFSERTPLGELNDRFEEGLKFTGSYPGFRIQAALQNGSDGAQDALRGTLRADVDLVGNGVPLTEQLYGSSHKGALTLGVGISDDGTLSRGESFAADLTYRGYGHFGSAEVVDRAQGLGGGTPFSLTYGYALDWNQVELGVRYSDLDDELNTSSMGIVANRYTLRDLAELQVSLERVSSDDPERDGWRLRLAVLFEL